MVWVDGGPCVRKLLTGLIMYIYPLKIKNIVLYCIDGDASGRSDDGWSGTYQYFSDG